MLYHKVVQGVSGYIARELNLSDKEKDRIRFALEVLISTLMSLALSLVLALILGIIKAVFFVIIAGAALKASAGGIHLKSPLECAVSTALVTSVLGLIATRYSQVLYKNGVWIVLISFLYILFSLLLWSPADVPEKPIKEIRKRQQLKKISILISFAFILLVGFLFLLGASRYSVVIFSILGGLLFQSFTISPAAYRLHNLYYNLKNRISTK